MKSFKFDLGSTVRITVSGEHGEVIGRTENTSCEPNYLVRYKSTDGTAVEQWWVESDLAIA